MNYFANLQAPQVPRNSLLDFSPVNNALSEVREQNNANRNALMRQEEQTYQRGRDAKQDARVAVQDSRADEQYFANAAKAYAQKAENDPVRANWPRMLKAKHPNFAALGPEYLDPIKGPALVMAEAGQYLDPRDSQIKDLEIEKTRAQIAQANRKSDNVVEVDGTLVRIGPDGQATPIYNSPTAGRGKAPPGYEPDPERPGALRAIPGGPGEFRSYTETQTKDAGFGARMLRAEDTLDQVMGYDPKKNEFKGYDPTRGRNAYFPDQSGLSNLYTANMINSKEWQQYIQASRESMAALLRKDTGAAITDQEFELYFPMYYPQPGDSKEVVMQKKAARQEIAKGLARSSGGAFEKAYPDRAQILNQGTQPASPPATGEWSIQRID